MLPLGELGVSRESAWRTLLGAAAEAQACELNGTPQAFATAADGSLKAVAPEEPDRVLEWRPDVGWTAHLEASDPRFFLFNLYLPICSGTRGHPITVGHLGQSLDGFIATARGESRFVNGPENILHLHRLRALSHAVLVGAGTVAADDPQLTTRQVPGPNPIRVILDPTRRLENHYRVFQDQAVETLYVCAQSLVGPAERTKGRAQLVPLEDGDGGVEPSAVIAYLRSRGCSRIFVEGGGVTVSLFLEAKALDRIHLAVAPLIIGEGRPGVRLRQPPQALGDCRRPTCQVLRMGSDVLFDCDLRSPRLEVDLRPTEPPAGPKALV